MWRDCWPESLPDHARRLSMRLSLRRMLNNLKRRRRGWLPIEKDFWVQVWVQHRPQKSGENEAKRHRINEIVLGSGPGGRWFKSTRPDHFSASTTISSVRIVRWRIGRLRCSRSCVGLRRGVLHENGQGKRRTRRPFPCDPIRLTPRRRAETLALVGGSRVHEKRMKSGEMNFTRPKTLLSVVTENGSGSKNPSANLSLDQKAGGQVRRTQHLPQSVPGLRRSETSWHGSNVFESNKNDV